MYLSQFMGVRASEIWGRKVRQFKSPTELGKIIGWEMDIERGQIKAFWLRGRRSGALKVEDLMMKEEVLESKKGPIKMLRRGNIKKPIGWRVVTESGRRLGRVYDFEFNLVDGRMEKIWSQLSLWWFWRKRKFVIGRKSIVEIEKKKIVVKDAILKLSDFNPQIQMTPSC